MDVEYAARQLAYWAGKNRLFALDGEVDNGGYDASATSQLLAGVGQLTAVRVLRDRGISYIAFNKEEKKISIFCNKAPRIKDLEAFKKAVFQGITIDLLEGGICHSGTQPPGPNGVPPFEHYKGVYYTCGSSIHLSTVMGAGTLGCLVRDSTGKLFGLSNNHVLADNNYADMDLPIFAPGQADFAPMQPDPKVVGHLRLVSPLLDGKPSCVPVAGNFDIALFEVADPNALSSMQRQIYDTPSDVIAPVGGMKVEKVGRTTGRTIGTVVGRVAAPAPVTCHIQSIGGKKNIYFSEADIIVGDSDAFSLPGDSGSLVTTLGADGRRKGVGVIFAGGGNLSFMVPLQPVLHRFGLSLVSGHNV